MIHFRFRFVAACALLLTWSAACASRGPGSVGEYRAEIRRTQGGIPHITASDLGSLGFGTLYAMAEDDPCILAEQYLTFGARRSATLGPEAGRLESDFFYQLLINRGQGAEPLPGELEELFAGAADGYNYFLSRTPIEEFPDRRCRGAEWVRPISALDVKRVSRADYAMAYLLPIVVAAAPPADSSAEALLDEEAFALAVQRYQEVPKEGGSNAVAVGALGSASGAGMLLANPHMPWNEPFQRFYPLHQTLEGRFDAIGANLIGRPRVGFGHNNDVAWTSTVSTAKRMTFYRLELDPEDPSRYLFDGVSRPMQREEVEVEVRGPGGVSETRRHTFYSTHFGAMLVESEIFEWTDRYAFAVRVAEGGWRGEVSALEQLSARSVRELKAIHDRHQFMTVNLIAADRSGEVLYGDLGPVPHLTDAQLEDCGLMRGAALDGSRSACQWGRDGDAAVEGIFGPKRAPFVFRRDFVTNSNDSHWLPNPASPLAGFPSIYGSEVTARTLRTRSGLRMVNAHLSPDFGDGDAKISLSELQALALSNESEAGRLLRDSVVRLCRAAPRVRLPEGDEVDLTEACGVLAGWDLRADLASQGAVLFREMMTAANGPAYTRHFPATFEFRTPFDPGDPIGTPRDLSEHDNPAVLQSLAQAVVRLRKAGIPLSAPLGSVQSVLRGGERIPLHGGPESEGIFNKIEAAFAGSEGYPDVTSWSSSWILAVDFGAETPRSRGILTYSLSSNPDSPHHADQTRLFSRKAWLGLPFRAPAVAAEAQRSVVLRAPRSGSR